MIAEGDQAEEEPLVADDRCTTMDPWFRSEGDEKLVTDEAGSTGLAWCFCKGVKGGCEVTNEVRAWVEAGFGRKGVIAEKAEDDGEKGDPGTSMSLGLVREGECDLRLLSEPIWFSSNAILPLGTSTRTLSMAELPFWVTVEESSGNESSPIAAVVESIS